MSTVKLSVIYYSATGNVHRIAEEIAKVAEHDGAEVRLRRVPELAPPEAIASNPAWAEHATATAGITEATLDDVGWADAVIFGSPTRFGNVSAQLKNYLDQLGPLWFQGKLADKIYSGFVSTGTAHGGQETTLMSLYNSIHHFGGVIVSPGYTDPQKYVDGNPYGTSHVSLHGENPVDETVLAAAAIQAKRVLKFARALPK
ncbi:MAG: NAD(P)H:quinone oxidoreductase [Pseudonocardiaceae bacterium]